MTNSNDGWEEMTSGEQTPAWDYKLESDLEGVYQGMKTNIGPNKSNMYTILTKKGMVGVWGTSLLDGKFPNIPLGNEVKLHYKGKTKNPKTGREYHDFQIFSRAPVTKG